jgi:FtsP/CotA-like multicopper oxidase with cupredoxin domain
MVMRRCNRRQFASGLAWAVAWQPPFASAQDGYAGQFITAAKTRMQLLGPESPPTDRWHFKTASGQPVIRAKQGQELRFRIFNELDEPLWLHFFGVRGLSEMMTVQVSENNSSGIEVVFTPPDAGTFWFGPLLNASKQREMGLAGWLIVDEVEEQNFQDLPIMFDDWSLGDDGKIEEDFANLDRAAGEGRLGNWFTANSTFKPRFSLNPEKPARLRLLNVANTRSLNLVFKGLEGIVLARDGQSLWPYPLGLSSLELAPGQRVDILITDAQEQMVIAIDLFEDVVETVFIDAAGYGRKTLPRNFKLSANPVANIDFSVPPRNISLVIEGGLKGGLQKAKVGKDELDLRAMLEQGLAWAIGGGSGLGSPPMFEASKGEVLRLMFENKTAFEQVLHVHGHVWTTHQPLPADFRGPQPPPSWTDTLVIPAKAQIPVLMVADNRGTWAIQSLIAERCDAGLIGAFTVSDMP